MSNYLYCSIAGANNQQKIDLLKSCEDVEVVIAVDNDSVGERCRQRNWDCESIVPKLKDWNEDWCQYQKSN